MRRDSLRLLVEADEIHGYVDALWSDGPIRRSHREGGLVHRIVDRFARLPRLFYEPSDPYCEWTQFSAWWGAILLCDYDNPIIRDCAICTRSSAATIRACRRAQPPGDGAALLPERARGQHFHRDLAICRSCPNCAS